jgi:hypothetical protein
MAQAAFERIRERRIRHEWDWLRRTAQADPASILVPACLDDPVILPQTPWYALDGTIRQSVAVRFTFPLYYPSVPLEAWLAEPALHPNIHPETGFVCLWDTRHEGTSLVEAVLQLQRVVTWHLFNFSADHLMQPDTGVRPALAYRPLAPPPDYYSERTAAFLPSPRRKRLS